jgi:hypothetical protein
MGQRNEPDATRDPLQLLMAAKGKRKCAIEGRSRGTGLELLPALRAAPFKTGARGTVMEVLPDRDAPYGERLVPMLESVDMSSLQLRRKSKDTPESSPGSSIEFSPGAPASTTCSDGAAAERKASLSARQERARLLVRAFFEKRASSARLPNCTAATYPAGPAAGGPGSAGVAGVVSPSTLIDEAFRDVPWICSPCRFLAPKHPTV